MAIAAASNMSNNRSGNGSFTPLRRKPAQNKQLAANLDILDKKDIRMRFKNSRDPLYIAFDYIDKRPVKELAVAFVKDTIFDVMNFVSGGTLA